MLGLHPQPCFLGVPWASIALKAVEGLVERFSKPGLEMASITSGMYHKELSHMTTLTCRRAWKSNLTVHPGRKKNRFG